MKHYKNLLLLPMIASLVACESDSTPSVLVDTDKISIEIRNTGDVCGLFDNALGFSLFEANNDLRLFGNDELVLFIDSLPLDVVKMDENDCYFVDLTDTDLDTDSLSEHLLELEYSRGTQQSYTNTLIFPEVTIDISDSSASIQPFSAQLLVDDALSTAEFVMGKIQLKSVESDDQGELCQFYSDIYKDDISADGLLELDLNSVTQVCETGTYTVSDDSEIVLQYKYVMNNVDGLESVTTVVLSTIDWPVASFTYNNN